MTEWHSCSEGPSSSDTTSITSGQEPKVEEPAVLDFVEARFKENGGPNYRVHPIMARQGGAIAVHRLDGAVSLYAQGPVGLVILYDTDASKSLNASLLSPENARDLAIKLAHFAALAEKHIVEFQG